MMLKRFRYHSVAGNYGEFTVNKMDSIIEVQ